MKIVYLTGLLEDLRQFCVGPSHGLEGISDMSSLPSAPIPLSSVINNFPGRAKFSEIIVIKFSNMSIRLRWLIVPSRLVYFTDFFITINY